MMEGFTAQVINAMTVGEWMLLADVCAGMPPDAQRSSVASILSKKVKAGIVVRRGRWNAYEYMLKFAWAPRDRETRSSEHAASYAGPAFDHGPLLQSIGLVCDPEVMPPDIASGIDALKRRTYEELGWTS